MAEVTVTGAEDSEFNPPSFTVKASETSESSERKNSEEKQEETEGKTYDSELKPGDNNVNVPYR